MPLQLRFPGFRGQREAVGRLGPAQTTQVPPSPTPLAAQQPPAPLGGCVRTLRAPLPASTPHFRSAAPSFRFSVVREPREVARWPGQVGAQCGEERTGVGLGALGLVCRPPEGVPGLGSDPVLRPHSPGTPAARRRALTFLLWKMVSAASSGLMGQLLDNGHHGGGDISSHLLCACVCQALSTVLPKSGFRTLNAFRVPL